VAIEVNRRLRVVIAAERLRLAEQNRRPYILSASVHHEI